MKPEFDIETATSGPTITVLRARGRLDARSAPVLAARCAEVRQQGRHLVLNLAGITFVASSGVGALLALVEEFHGSPSSVRLVEMSPAVSSVIKLLNLGPFLDIDATEAAAADALKAA